MARGFNYAPGASEDAKRAAAPGLSRDEIATLAASRNPVVREIVAARDDLTLAVSVTLVHDSATDVRASLGGNTHVTETILEHLSSDRQRDVVLAVAGNARASRHVLEQLALHKRAEVREAALANLEARPEDESFAGAQPAAPSYLTATSRGADGADDAPWPFISNG